MAIAENTYRSIAIGKQSALGTPALTNAGKTYGFRPDTQGGLTKEAFESDSIRRDQQFNNPRHGLRQGQFTLSQELQIGGHNDLLAAACRAAWATGGTTTASTISIDASAREIERSGGSWITDGFKVGDIVRCSGFTAAANNGCNLRITDVTATVMTYADDSWLPTLVTEAAGNSVTVATPGKKLAVPSTGHTKDYFTIEDWHSDINQSTVISDARIGTVSIDVSPGAHATISFQFLGRDATFGSSEYFVAPTAAPTGALLAGPEGVLTYDGTDSAVMTGVQIEIGSNAEVKSVVGANVSPDVFTAGVRVTGSISSLFDGGAVLTNFDDEAEAALLIHLFATSAKDSDFLTIKLPRAKINGADKSTDGTALTLSGNFSAGKETTSTVLEQTTIVFHDSSVV